MTCADERLRQIYLWKKSFFSKWIIFFNCIFFLAVINWPNFKFQNVKTDRSIDEALETVPDHIWPCPVNIVAIPWLPVAIDTGNKLAQRIITSIYYQSSELTIDMPQKLKRLTHSRVSSRSGCQNLKMARDDSLMLCKCANYADLFLQ